MTFGHELHTRPDSLHLALSGEIDFSMREDLRGILDALIESSPGVTDLDLHDVTFLDCCGIGEFVHAHAAARRRGATFTVSRPQGIVHTALALTHVLEFLAPDRTVPDLPTR